MTKIQQIQEIIGTAPDGRWGPISQAAFDAVIGKTSTDTRRGLCSSFADLADVRAFKRCKATGASDQACFRVGDNGIGCWGDLTAQETDPMCAVPPDDMIMRWGSVDAAKHKKVLVTANGKTITVKLADRMPWKKNIKNGAIIDLNPAAAKELGLKPPFMVNGSWTWA